MCVSTTNHGQENLELSLCTLWAYKAVGMGLGWMWLKALVKGPHLVKAPWKDSLVIWLLFGVFGFLSSIRQPWVFSEKREMLQYSEVKPKYTLSSKVKVSFTVSTVTTLHVQDTGWSQIMQGGLHTII